MANKHRKPGAWKDIAHSRNNVPRILVNGRGLSNTPKVTETGSAAYRRLQRKVSGHVE